MSGCPQNKSTWLFSRRSCRTAAVSEKEHRWHPKPWGQCDPIRMLRLELRNVGSGQVSMDDVMHLEWHDDSDDQY